MKKVELHVHIDGSVRVHSAWEMALERGLHLAENEADFQKLMQVKEDCTSLAEYLACFDPVLAILQDPDAIYRCTYELIEDLAKDDVIYAEIRFAPAQHTKKGASQEAILQSALRAIEDARHDFPAIRVNLILCMMVLKDFAFTQADNEETLRLAIAYHQKGVCALDLAGAEGAVPLKAYMPYFMEAKLNALPYTIHAGENPYPQHVETALIMGAKRIGHGIAVAMDPYVMKLLKEKQVPLEICFSSNLHSQVAKADTHPFRTLLDHGIAVTINTDNRTISNTTLAKEYELLKKYMGCSEEELRACNHTAIQNAFLSPEEKAALYQQLDA